MSKNLYVNPDIYDVMYSGGKDDHLRGYYTRVLGGRNIETIHDCSFGTGHLTLVLAELGYKVSGSDLSSEMLKNGALNAKERGLDIPLFEADFRQVDQHLDKHVDCIMSTGNSLAHVDNEGVGQALTSMAACVKAGGYLYLDTRNWDKIIDEKERFFLYNPIMKNDERINLVQVWDHLSDKHVRFNMLYTFEKNNRIYKKEIMELQYYPVLLEFFKEVLKDLSFEEIEVFNFGPDKCDFQDMNWYAIIAKKK